MSPPGLSRGPRLRHVHVGLGALCAFVACARSAAAPPGPEELVVRVVRSYPHDRGAFTQGLQVAGGKLYESTGLAGRSSLREVDLASGAVERQVELPAPIFAEGLTRVGPRLLQLTWRDGRLFVWDLATFAKQREIEYGGEGWGLCFDGKRLVMSDGSGTLSFRDPESFAKLGEVAVKLRGRALSNLNELECVDDVVYANVWQTNFIARIDPRTGVVTGLIDASDLLSPEALAGADVLNGIAALPERGRFLVTGKLWPKIFEVEIVPRNIKKKKERVQ